MNKILKFQYQNIRLGDCFVSDLFLYDDSVWIIVNRSPGAVLAIEVGEDDQISYLFESDMHVLKLYSCNTKPSPIDAALHMLHEMKYWLQWRGISAKEAVYSLLSLSILLLVASLLVYGTLQT